MSTTASAASSFNSLQPHPSDPPSPVGGDLGIVGSSAEMRRLRLQVRRIGPHFRTVLLSGEAGTGKGLVARSLHGMVAAPNGPFVVCHGAALEEALAEWQMPEGHSIGSANTLSRLVTIAQRGTLVIDAINEMPLEAQLCLLRILRRHESVLRVIAATSENLKILASTGYFLPELYPRLAMLEISLPPLRMRRDDIVQLTHFLLKRIASAYGKEAPIVSEEAMKAIQAYHWPGNVRELESVLRSCLLKVVGEVLELHHLPEFVEVGVPTLLNASTGESARLQDVIEQHVLRVLKSCRGNKLRTAEMLGVSRSTLYRMLDACAPVQAREK